MRRLVILILYFTTVITVFITGIHVGTYYNNKNLLKNIAISLVESFGWEISDTTQISEIVEQKFIFNQTYKNWTVSKNSDISSGNIEGIMPLFLRKDDITSNDENVYCYIIPVDYDMPEDVQLQAIVAFYDGKICMSAIHADSSKLIDKITDIEKEALPEVADEDIIPSTWPLNVEADILEKWKSKFLRFIK